MSGYVIEWGAGTTFTLKLLRTALGFTSAAMAAACEFLTSVASAPVCGVVANTTVAELAAVVDTVRLVSFSDLVARETNPALGPFPMALECR